MLNLGWHVVIIFFINVLFCNMDESIQVVEQVISFLEIYAFQLFDFYRGWENLIKVIFKQSWDCKNVWPFFFL